MTASLQFGLEVLREAGFEALRSKRVGLMSNPSAVDARLRSTYDILRQAEQVDLAALFGAEHGFLALAADGIHVEHVTDPRTGVPIYSLYGETFRPSVEMLRSIDVLVCDLQDIGARFYTYIWTISYILQACGQQGVEVMILDRPNPLGDVVAGPLLKPGFSSFVGRYPLPVQHGMTMGELAGMMNAIWNPTPCQLTVISCVGWQRDMRWDQTGRIFVPPSPAIPHALTASHYPGSCLIEGINCSEGRGTALPFEIVGAPYVDGHHLAELLNEMGMAGLRFRPHSFTPSASKWQGEACTGVQIHIMDANGYQPVRTWLTVVHTLRHLYPADFHWLEPYSEGGLRPFDRLIGSDRVRQQINDGEDLALIMASWEDEENSFRALRQPYLLYPEALA